MRRTALLRKWQKPTYTAAGILGLILAILLFASTLPAGNTFAYAGVTEATDATLGMPEEPKTTVALPEDPASPPIVQPENPEVSEIPAIQPGKPEDTQDETRAPPLEGLIPDDGQIAAGDEQPVKGAGEDMDLSFEEEEEEEEAGPVITATIDLSEARNVDYQATMGYEISSTGSHTYSSFKPILGNDPFKTPAYTQGVLTFYANAAGKTFKLVQSGVRMGGSGETKNGTVIVPVINIDTGVKDVTLILEDIDLGSHANNDNLYGYILLRADSTTTLLLGTDQGNPSIGSSYVRGSIHVLPGATLTIDSADISGSSSGTITVTTHYTTAAAIGGDDNGTEISSGAIVINGGTVNATQSYAGSTGAAIGGGGRLDNSGQAGAGYVTINGGTVNASSTGRGAAIGGGGIMAFNALAGTGNVTITNGVVNAVNTGFGAAIGGGAAVHIDSSTGANGHPGACDVSITGGLVTATAYQGAAIGSGFLGYQGKETNDRIVNIGEGAVIKAYSSGKDSAPIFSGQARPAIDVSGTNSVTGDGYFVNARLNAADISSSPTTLMIRKIGVIPVIDTLTLPATYRNFAYTTGLSRTDYITAYNASGSEYRGTVIRDNAGKSRDIFSINTTVGYNGQGVNDHALLPVTLDINIAPIDQRYIIYQGAPENSSPIASRHLLADAVAVCTQNNVPYTIVATENDPNMTGSAASAITIPAGKVIRLTSNGMAPGGAWTVTTQKAARHFYVLGSLTLDNIILDGGGVGGGLRVSGTAVMAGGSVIQNCTAADLADDPGKGGGVYVAGGSFSMSGDAKLTGNTAGAITGSEGGGVYTLNYSYLQIGPNAMFENNTASEGFDLAAKQSEYQAAFPTIHSPFGSYYSVPTANHPVNNNDINIRSFLTVTVKYIDKQGNPLAPPSIAKTSKDYRVLPNHAFDLNDIGDRIIPVIDGYVYAKWAFMFPDNIVPVDTIHIERVPMSLSIYVIYEERVTTTVTVSKTVEGKYADMTESFPFAVYLYEDAAGTTPVTPGGEYRFSLSHGEDYTIKNVPAGAYIQVVEDVDETCWATSFKDSAAPASTPGADTGVTLVGTALRAFAFENAVVQIVPAGIRAGVHDTMTPLIITAILLLAAILVTARLRYSLLRKHPTA